MNFPVDTETPVSLGIYVPVFSWQSQYILAPLEPDCRLRLDGLAMGRMHGEVGHFPLRKRS